jgi:hypothetical protein
MIGFGRGNRSTRRKPAPTPLCPPQIPPARPGREPGSAGLLDVQNILLADTDTSQKTEGHSFGDHLICGSVSATQSGVIEVSIVLCSVSL